MITQEKLKKLEEVNPNFAVLLEKVIETHLSKSHDYAKTDNPFSNFEQTAERVGVSVDTVFKLMLAIKEARLDSLISEGKTPNNESIADTMLDHAVYSLLRAAYRVREDEKAQPTVIQRMRGVICPDESNAATADGVV